MSRKLDVMKILVDIDSTDQIVCEVLKADAKMLEKEIKRLKKLPSSKMSPFSDDLESDMEYLGAMRALISYYCQQ